MVEAYLYKQLFIYLLPLNFLVGDVNLGFQYRFAEEWAADLNVGYTMDIEGSFSSNIYEEVFKGGTFYYSGPFVKASLISLIPRGPNPLRTDYNQIEVGYRMLSYDSLDFEDQIEPGKLFNISEDMKAVNLSWKAGYNILPRAVFEINGFVGFGIQMRFKNTWVNSYGYNYISNEFIVNDQTKSMQTVPLFHVGVKIGLKNRIPSN
jgi:hypothetical protein